MIKYRDLKEDPPTGKEYCVVLFPCRTDCGNLYITSNPKYARANGLKAGYTHWFELPLAPNHDELVRWQKSINEENEEY